MRYCKNCDKAFPDDHMFCPKCGSRLMSEAEVAKMNADIENKLLEEKRQKEHQKEVQKIAYQRASELLAYQHRHLKEMTALNINLNEYQLQNVVDIVNSDASWANKTIAVGERKIESGSVMSGRPRDIYNVLIDHKNFPKEKLYQELLDKYQKCRDLYEKYIRPVYRISTMNKFAKTRGVHFYHAMMFGGYFSMLIKTNNRLDYRNSRTIKNMYDDNVIMYDVYRIYDNTYRDYYVSLDLDSRMRKNVCYGNDETAGLYYFLYLDFLKSLHEWLSKVEQVRRECKVETEIIERLDKRVYYYNINEPDRFINRYEVMNECRVYKNDYHQKEEVYDHYGPFRY